MNDSRSSSIRDLRDWLLLVALALAQFLVVLDVTIVNVALPSIGAELSFASDAISWVVNAYTLAFGGLLLLGGRLADVIGRRAMFLTGLGLLTAASLGGGLADTAESLVAARVVQGLGAALMSPAALALVLTTFPEGRGRATALGVWTSLGALGGTAGVALGGVLIEQLGWRWVFFVNVPIAVLIVPFVLGLVRESRAPAARGFDAAGAVTATAGATLLVAAAAGTADEAWIAIMFAIAGLVLLGVFVAIELRSRAPLVPLGMLAARPTWVGILSLALNGAAFVGMFFLLAQSLQAERGMSALEAGLAVVPMGLAAIGGAVLAGALVPRIGTRLTAALGATVGAAALGALALAGPASPYSVGVLPAIVAYGLAIPLVGVPSQIAAVHAAPRERVGTASGAANAANQLGAALGVAAAASVSSSFGFAAGFALTAAFAAAVLLLVLAAAPTLGVRSRPQSPRASRVRATARSAAAARPIPEPAVPEEGTPR
ncbi:MFS transporter [Agromyces bauzanensis]|uniref:MFS transporter n=1 Tax=Agromyces bauzanensis TaxID=1308924 RepID=UPI001669437A|nr:MFS transporter [Agromyces bauzanensis]